jgi:hypothetical protein
VAGRQRAELWSHGPGGFSCTGDKLITVDGGTALPSLATALQELFKVAKAQPGGRAVHVVLESAWLPVMGIDLGDTLWAKHKLQALLQHRLVQLHGPDQAGGWDLQLDHQAGDALAQGFGLAREVKAAVLAGAATTETTVASIQPAFAWSMDRWLPGARRAKAAWWLWCEQDRTLVAHVQRGRVAALNPAAPPVRNAEDCRALIACESIRLGSGAANALAWIGGWHLSQADSELETHRVAFVGLQQQFTGSARQEAVA